MPLCRCFLCVSKSLSNLLKCIQLVSQRLLGIVIHLTTSNRAESQFYQGHRKGDASMWVTAFLVDYQPLTLTFVLLL